VQDNECYASGPKKMWQSVLACSSVISLWPVHFLSPDQQSGIHCLIICVIQLLAPNDLGGTWKTYLFAGHLTR